MIMSAMYTGTQQLCWIVVCIFAYVQIALDCAVLFTPQ